LRLSSLLNLGLIAVGAAASVKTLQRRRQWERSNQRTYIVLDYDDALSVSVRAGVPLSEFLRAAQQHGATHLSLPELTLDRLLREGRLAPTIPEHPLTEPPPVGHWVYLTSTETELLDHLARELRARLPASQAQLLPPSSSHRPPSSVLRPVLAFSGHLPTLAEMGLGFETKIAADVTLSGLGLVPRPVSYSWPEPHLVERTLAQVAGLGANIVAFEGNIILGHEMHLDTTVACLERLGLNFAYFSQTRHQKGDWFIAKRLAPRGQVILAHYFTPAALVPEDYHSAAHHWGMLAHARGIRLCYINVFRRIHATEPLECLHYLEHVRKNLDAFDGSAPGILPAPDRETLALSGLAPAGAISFAATGTLGIPEPIALGLSVLSAAGAYALPYLDRPRGTLEEASPPSYAPKLLALAAASAAPLASSVSDDLLVAALIQSGAAASLAALTTGQDYQQHIETYRSLNADLFLPLIGVVLRELDNPTEKIFALTALGASWYAANKIAPDILGRLDQDLPAGHTHHLSAAQRLIGDALIALGPRPARKWSGLGLIGVAAASALRRRCDPRSRSRPCPDLGDRRGDPSGRPSPYVTLAASLVGVIGNAAMLAAFRTPERPLTYTLPNVGKSWAWGGAVGGAVLLLLTSGTSRSSEQFQSRIARMDEFNE